MSLYTVLPTTQRLDELVAAVVLGDHSALSTKEGTVLYQYTWPREQELAVKKEVFYRAGEIKAAGPWATVEAPKTKLLPARLISGELSIGPDELGILVLFQQAELQTWREGTSRRKSKLMPGLILIHPSVYFSLPKNVPFAPLLCHIPPSDNARQLQEG
ncbi:hypothetical protein BDY21DRAFT_343591 [Lineolata rhizophorae]|uniref:Uncharacterized protein n=1 Tax=Lineolata rhizophorae TaxID=578093 RepID=A0A6A6P0Q4_9PEZI|nr:hypothetical protein BDY21DRAFT_343591 [Lineolata rhizophorae]